MINTDALVLRRSDYRDYDRMVTLLSPTYGRIEASARGVKKPKSPLINATEPFCAGEFGFVSTKGGLTLSQCEIVESNYPIRQDLGKLIHASYYAYLLLLAAYPQEPCPGLFQLALKALAHLSYSGLPNELVTCAFELHYMAELGQSPRMDSCIHCGAAVDGDARFDASGGGVLCQSCRGQAAPISNGARRILMKTPRVAFEKVDLLKDRPEWPEAAAHIRRFVSNRIEQFPRQMPELITGGQL